MPAIDVSFTDSRNSMLHWYPRLENISVPCPATEFFSLNQASSSIELIEGGVETDALMETLSDIPVEEISSKVEELPTEKSHIRGDFKSSSLAGGEGREIIADNKVIHEQVLHLLDSLLMSGFPKQALVVREWVDVDTIAESYMGHIAPEVRFIVDGGEVLGGFVDVYEEEFDSSFSEQDVKNILSDLEETFEENYDYLKEIAEKVAKEFDETGWSVDFIQDTEGSWHITDMAIYGLYWNESKDAWHSISHVPEDKSYNLAENLPDNLPDEPENPSRSR
jgi:hypothetical protein